MTYGTANKVRLHAILDLYGQRPAAWLISPTETREAAIKVFNQAAKASGTTPEMIHTDRGAAYTSTNYNEALRQEKVRHSLSAPGTPADNAVMEHWWADFKSIWLEHRPKAQTLAELQEQVRAGIMYFTNQFISAKEMTKPWRNITTIWLDKKNCVFVFIMTPQCVHQRFTNSARHNGF
ncbi:DDE-type integrase/transposase/recombinase [Limosilactobacillus fermentum]|nr:DDE-type integrase/transposase/recombinase [Limosilactobacillus fermentum]